MSRSLARTVSILGHPLLMLPLALLLPAVAGGLPGTGGIAIAFALAAALVMGWSWRRVRQGRWAHVDASAGDERRSLHRFLLPVLAAAMLLALWAPAGVSLYLGLSALIVAVAMLLARWCTLSLHAAFAVFAALMLLRWTWWAGAAALAFAALVIWSRLALARHRPRDLGAGVATGTGAALLSWPLAPHWPSP
ncbi:hypothetical protein [Luteimonas salinilitoris]|uniref:Uncharacterized protein n=1 Tax=Luteimonas salinilitoris TaxID=3237697 RepID=A0ABV4HK87_9GAMM